MKRWSIEAVARRIVRALHPQKIILFGSRAHGTPGPDSDADLLVIMESNQPAGRRAANIHRLLGERPYSLDILVFTPEEVRKGLTSFDPFLEEIIKKGRVLYEAG